MACNRFVQREIHYASTESKGLIVEAYIYSFVCCQLFHFIFGGWGGAINANVCVSVFLNGQSTRGESHKVPSVLPKEADNQHEAKD